MPTTRKKPAGINAKQPHWKKHGSEISYTFIDCIASQWEELIGYYSLKVQQQRLEKWKTKMFF